MALYPLLAAGPPKKELFLRLPLGETENDVWPTRRGTKRAANVPVFGKVQAAQKPKGLQL